MAELIYDYKFGIKNQPPSEVLKSQTDSVVKEVKERAGGSTEVFVKIEDEGASLYSVSLNVISPGDIYHVKKVGKKIIPTIKKAKRSMLRQIKKEKTIRAPKRRKPVWRQLEAS